MKNNFGSMFMRVSEIASCGSVGIESMFPVSSFLETASRPYENRGSRTLNTSTARFGESRFAIMPLSDGEAIATGCLTMWRTTMANKAKLRANDLVRVKQADGQPGPTLYLIDWMGERGYCTIREAGNPLAGGREFDTSLLVKESRDRVAA
jgi:hypothetical protein